MSTMRNNSSVCLYLSHDCSIAWNINDEIKCIQFEKVTGERYQSSRTIPNEVMVNVLNYIKQDLLNHDINNIQNFIIHPWLKFRPLKVPQTDYYKVNQLQLVWNILNPNALIKSRMHHRSHACTGFYTSPFDEALVISFDGGGDEETFTTWHGCRSKGLTQLNSINCNLGRAYIECSVSCKELNYSSSWTDLSLYDKLSSSGKAMGLVASGKLDDSIFNWLKDIEQFKKQQIFHKLKTIPDFESADLMYTAQHILEHKFILHCKDVLDEYKHLPVVITGGCALNVINNEKVKSLIYPREVFVPSCPGDEGLSIGCVLDVIRPGKQVTIHNRGPHIEDKAFANSVLTSPTNTFKKFDCLFNFETTTFTNVSKLLNEGNIIGLVQGPSEIGPRALGYRSILCDPSYPNMKDKVNKIKHRESFRPFAPVCRLQDASKYFDSVSFKHMEYMGFAVKALPSSHQTIPAVIHGDGTARLQTVTEDSNQYLYDLLTTYEQVTGKHVLMNTSFNVRGKAILNTLREALYVLSTSKLDFVLYENVLIKRHTEL